LFARSRRGAVGYGFGNFVEFIDWSRLRDSLLRFILGRLLRVHLGLARAPQ
jgi:hypothetical protein